MDHALFFPSGTMANQTAINILTSPGDQLICSKYAHVYNYEGGGVSFNSGVSCKLIDKPRGLFNYSDVEAAINPLTFIIAQKHLWYVLRILQTKEEEHVGTWMK